MVLVKSESTAFLRLISAGANDSDLANKSGTHTQYYDMTVFHWFIAKRLTMIR